MTDPCGNDAFRKGQMMGAIVRDHPRGTNTTFGRILRVPRNARVVRGEGQGAISFGAGRDSAVAIGAT
ncbi:hypothetical protein FQZ97_1030780 [compost metagenome]